MASATPAHVAGAPTASPRPCAQDPVLRGLQPRGPVGGATEFEQRAKAGWGVSAGLWEGGVSGMERAGTSVSQ